MKLIPTSIEFNSGRRTLLKATGAAMLAGCTQQSAPKPVVDPVEISQAPQKPKPTPTEGQVRAQDRKNQPIQQTLNEDLAKELAKPDFTFTRENIDKVTKILNDNATQSYITDIKYAIPVSKDESNLPTLYLTGKANAALGLSAGTNIVAIRHHAPKEGNPAYLDMTPFARASVDTVKETLKFEILNIGDKSYENGQPILNDEKLPHRDVPMEVLKVGEAGTPLLRQLGILDTDLPKIQEQLNAIGLNANGKVLRFKLPEIRQVTCSKGNPRDGGPHYAEGKQTTVQLTPVVSKNKRHTEAVSDKVIDVLLIPARNKEGQLIPIELNTDKHLNNPNASKGKPVVNRTQISDPKFEIRDVTK